ncbi:hypothetical protein [Kordiimonas aestuarii]|uniref:hypothetical protein n=1 Tax=Kordiimonas aestuarii TaxID=1005925 RepID=UPI0021CF60AC|nr:hypothetical protein [Kordiimonas aestuarii]
MRMVILVAAFGMLGGTLVLSPVASPAVHAQTVTAERAVQAQLIALAQSGDWDGFGDLVDTQVAAGNTAMLVRIAGNLADMGLTLADADDEAAVALELAALALADNASIAGADQGLAARVGSAAGKVRTKIAGRNPSGAAALASAAARSSATGLFAAYSSGALAAQNTGNTSATVLTRLSPPRPDQEEVPVIVEANPSQSGSPTS